MLDIKEFQYILAIAQESSISSAAKKLFITQSSLSQFLKNYEDALKTQLFIRSPSGIKPTYAGWRFIEMATNITKTYHAFQGEIDNISHIEYGKIAMGIPSNRIVILSEVLARFSKLYPNITVNVQQASSGILEKELENDNIDIALLVGPTRNDNLDLVHVATEEVFLAAAKHHSIHAEIKGDRHIRRWVDIERIREEEFIILEKGHRTYDLSKEFFEEHCIKPRRIRECSSFELCIGWANTGTGLVFLPKTFLGLLFQLSSNLDYFSLGNQGLYREFHIATNTKKEKNTPVKPLSKIMQGVILEYFSTLDPLQR
jgi:DNA-binding transcriptional LysR family regulator